MICSPAKLEANQRNAARSTGPKTPKGKAASRANSFKHGLTGHGIVVPPSDLERISAVAQDIRDEHHPSTVVGLAMADRAAMLLVRLDRAGLHELAMVHDQVATAVHEFDQFRRDWADELFDGLETEPYNLVELKRFPEGLDRLIDGWNGLAEIDAWSADDLEWAARLSAARVEDPASLRFSIPNEVRRLETARAAVDTRPIERARKQAAELALFSDSREAILARKYEASTERAYHKAIKTLKEAEAPNQGLTLPDPPQIPTATDTLGSFSPELRPSPEQKPVPEPAVDATPSKLPVDRDKRPDPKKLREAQRRNRR